MAETRNKRFASLQETLRHYHMPTLVMGLGVVLSIAGFLFILRNNTEEMEREFRSYAILKTSALEHSLGNYERALELVQRFYEASSVVTKEEFRYFVEPMFSQANFHSFWWVHGKDGHYEMRYRRRNATALHTPQTEDITGLPAILAVLSSASASGKAAVSDPFLLPAKDGERTHIALVYPHQENGHIQGYIVGVVDLQAVLSREVRWESRSEDTEVYLLDHSGHRRTPLYSSTAEGENFAQVQADDTRLAASAPFYHQAFISLSSRVWELRFIPTAQYLARASSPLAWLVLSFGISLTALVSLFLFFLVTQRLRIEQQVAAQTRELRHLTVTLASSEKKIRAVMDHTVDGLITISEQGIIESYNRACERIFGYTAAETIGQNVNMLMPEPYHREHDGYLKNYRESGEAKIIGIGREVEGKRKDGSVFPIDLAVSQVQLGDRRIYSGIVRDISERKEQESQREELIARLEESNTELERFAYIASHDLQEPLRMVTNFTELLAKKYSDRLDADARRYIDYASSGARRMRDLVNDLLEYARVSQEAERYEQIDSVKLMEYVRMNLQESIAESGARIVVEGELPPVSGNPVRLARLLQNLIGNAIKYRRAGVHPEIRISAEDKGNEWMFCVQDNGIGIKREYCQQIFLPFKRLHTREEYSGNGIGLSICRRVVESMGGTIYVESEPGKGSRFYFTLPKFNESVTQEKAA